MRISDWSSDVCSSDLFEFGLKADFFDRHLRTNLAAFTYSFDGLQSTLSQIIDGVAINNFVNAGNAKINGAELEAVILPFENIELSLGGAYLDTKIRSVATGGLGLLPGKRLPTEIGRASRRASVCQYVALAVWDV